MGPAQPSGHVAGQANGGPRHRRSRPFQLSRQHPRAVYALFSSNRPDYSTVPKVDYQGHQARWAVIAGFLGASAGLHPRSFQALDQANDANRTANRSGPAKWGVSSFADTGLPSKGGDGEGSAGAERPPNPPLFFPPFPGTVSLGRPGAAQRTRRVRGTTGMGRPHEGHRPLSLVGPR